MSDNGPNPDLSDALPSMEELSDIMSETSRQTWQMMENFLSEQPEDVRSSLDPLNMTPTLLEMTKQLSESPAVLLQSACIW